MDVESLISGLVKVSRDALSPLKSRVAATNAAVTSISDVSSLLGKLKVATQAIDTVQEASSYTATSSDSKISAIAGSGATPGAYTLQVQSLASEQRNYSNTYSSPTEALGQAGTLSIARGAESPIDIEIASDDTLRSVVSKINGANAGVSAAIFFDGQDYRLQLRGQATGAENAFSVSESGSVALGLSAPSAVVQQARDATVLVDGFTVTRPTNQLSDVVPGVTLNLAGIPTDPVQIEVKADPAGLTSKVKTAVDAFNSVVDKIHSLAGFGSLKATNPVLAGDSTLRGVASRLSNIVFQSIDVGGTQMNLATLGINLTRTGKLELDTAKLETFVGSNPGQAAELLAGTDATDGLMDILHDLVDTMVDETDGSLATSKTALEGRAKTMQERYDRESARVDKYGERLRAQFTAMDARVAINNMQMQYLANLG